jgi:outer membrane murein-binding lipoprotein Lpp
VNNNRTWQEVEDHRQNGGAVAWLVIALFIAAIVCAVLLLSGCAAGNKTEVSAVKFEPSRKSTTAENIDAGGKVAAGAWDRLFGNKANQEK